jgi:hypothetical protein
VGGAAVNGDVGATATTMVARSNAKAAAAANGGGGGGAAGADAAGAGGGGGAGAGAGAPGGKDNPKNGGAGGGGDPGGEDESVILHPAGSEEFNQEAVVHELITIAYEPTMAMVHDRVIRASVIMVTKAGLKFVPFLPRIIPALLHMIRLVARSSVSSVALALSSLVLLSRLLVSCVSSFFLMLFYIYAASLCTGSLPNPSACLRPIASCDVVC